MGAVARAEVRTPRAIGGPCSGSLPSRPRPLTHTELCFHQLLPPQKAVLRFVTKTAEALGSGPQPSRTYLSFYAVTVCEVVGAAPKVRE